MAVPRNIQLVAAHIQGKLNLDIDLLLRSFSHETEWMFNQKVFNKICRDLLKHETDLMASSSDTQLPNFISWKANRKAIYSNVFHMLWGNNKAYIFQFFSLITKAGAKVEQDQTHLIRLIAHFWKTQPCFPLLLKLLTTTPLLLPKSQKLLSILKTKKDSLSMEGTSTDRVSLIRESLHHCNFSDNVEELTLQSWRASTQVKYKPVLGKWYNFCTE